MCLCCIPLLVLAGGTLLFLSGFLWEAVKFAIEEEKAEP